MCLINKCINFYIYKKKILLTLKILTIVYVTKFTSTTKNNSHSTHLNKEKVE